MSSPSGVVASAATRHRPDRYRADAYPSISTARPSPGPLRLADLLRITDEVAADVLDGFYADIVPDPLPAAERWSLRVRRDEEVEVWLISWVLDRSTELHDHAGSLGALTVIHGALDETRWTGTELKTRRLSAGDQAAFPLGRVHNVVAAAGNGLPAPDLHTPDLPALDLPAPDLPTLSVHAYSPPLTAMSHYRVLPDGRLGHTRTELTEPEAIR